MTAVTSYTAKTKVVRLPEKSSIEGLNCPDEKEKTRIKRV
jgi:hypothetical protein